MTATATDLVFRSSAERFHSRLDWLNSWHSFSFAGHVDPAWMGFGPLRVINDDTIAAGSGFGMHPHQDMEIVTVMVEGQLMHRDSMGHSEVLSAGEVQRVSAGTGVVHSEINESDQPCRLLQIWIEPSCKGSKPVYEQKRFSIGASWTLLLDPDQADGAMAIQSQARLWRAQPPAAQSLSLALASGSRGWIQMIGGSGEADGHPLRPGDGVGFGAGRLELFRAGPEGADLLLFELH